MKLEQGIVLATPNAPCDVVKPRFLRLMKLSVGVIQRVNRE